MAALCCKWYTQLRKNMWTSLAELCFDLTQTTPWSLHCGAKFVDIVSNYGNVLPALCYNRYRNLFIQKMWTRHQYICIHTFKIYMLVAIICYHYCIRFMWQNRYQNYETIVAQYLLTRFSSETNIIHRRNLCLEGDSSYSDACFQAWVINLLLTIFIVIIWYET